MPDRYNQHYGTHIIVTEDTVKTVLQRVIAWAEADRQWIKFHEDTGGTGSYVRIPPQVILGVEGAVGGHGDLVLKEGGTPVELATDKAVWIEPSIHDVDGINPNTLIEYDMVVENFGPKGRVGESMAALAWTYKGNSQEKTEPSGWVFRYRQKVAAGQMPHKWLKMSLVGQERLVMLRGLTPDTEYEATLQGVAIPTSTSVNTAALNPVTFRTDVECSGNEGVGKPDGGGGEPGQPTLTVAPDPADPTGRTVRAEWSGFPQGPVTIDWGDGTPAQTVQGPSGQATHAYPEGTTTPQTITATSGSDPSKKATGTFTPGDGGGEPGQPTLTAAPDPADPTGRTVAVTLAGFPEGPVAVDWGDGTPPTTVPAGQTTASHPYPETATGLQTITATSQGDPSKKATGTFTPGDGGGGDGAPQFDVAPDPADPSGHTIIVSIDNTGDGGGGDVAQCCEENAQAVQALEQRVKALEDAGGGGGGGLTREDVEQMLAQYASAYIDDTAAGDDAPDVEFTGSEYAPTDPEMALELTVPPSQKALVGTFLHARGDTQGSQVYQSVIVEHGGQQVLEPLDARGVTLAVDQADEASSSSISFLIDFAELEVAAGETVRIVAVNRAEGQSTGTIIDRNIMAVPVLA